MKVPPGSLSLETSGNCRVRVGGFVDFDDRVSSAASVMNSTDVRDVFRLAGTTLEGRFVVDRAIAEGGFGVVYLAQQAALERPVALKVLKTPARFEEVAKQQFLASFAAEAKTIARITHTNIVHVHDFGVSVMPSGERAAWMALEWLTGETLDDELMRRRGHGGRTPAECLDLLKPALSALAVVHAAGVAHRDLKPANIMLVPTPAGPTPKLLDFGIAKMMDADEAPGSGQTQTRSGQIAFSPGYASPEQISQGRSGPWTDVHAMGLILTEMLIDRAPLEGDETALIFQQIVDRVRPTPAKFGVTVGAWEGVLCRALAVSPGERYRDAGELLKALEATVAEATATYTTLRGVVAPSITTLPKGGVQTLGAMSTLPAPVASGMTPVPAPRPHVTTSTPTSDDAPSIPLHAGKRSPGLLVGGAVALAVLVGVGWRVIASAPPRAASLTLTPSTSAAPAPPAVVTVGRSDAAPAASVEAVSSAPLSAMTASGQAVPQASPPPASATPKVGLGNASTAAATPAVRPRPKVTCDPPYTVDPAGQKHWKPECN